MDRAQAFICDGARTPIGRYGGALSRLRVDDLAALPLRALRERNEAANFSQLDDILLGCANQAGEDNRNVARMAALLAGYPIQAPAMTLNRLCASGLDAVGAASRALRSGDCDFMIAGGVEGMSRAPFVMPKPERAFSRDAALYDTTIGWRFVNPALKAAYGVDSMPQTADNVATDFDISREDQDAFAHRSQQRWARAQEAGIFKNEMIPVMAPDASGEIALFEQDEHPRPQASLEKLGRLKGVNGPDLSVTPGNASGVNDGAAALLMASETGVRDHGLSPIARVICFAAAGVEPRIMGMGPVPAIKKALLKAGLSLDEMEIIELNEAFAAQALAVTRALGLPDDAAHVNPNGGAIALGHPLGMSGARLALTAAMGLRRSQARYALCAMCVGVGQGVAMILERV